MSEGLRQRKKSQTRQDISDKATLLFVERGFDKVTIGDVAAAVGVAKMTVTNYFPRKEDLVLDRHEEIIAEPVRALAQRRPGESALDAIRRAYFHALDRREPTLGFTGTPFARMVLGSRALLARLREIYEQREDALAAALAAETGDNGTRPRMAAAQLTAAHRMLVREAFRRMADGETQDDVAAALAAAAREAFDLLEPILHGYAAR